MRIGPTALRATVLFHVPGLTGFTIITISHESSPARLSDLDFNDRWRDLGAIWLKNGVIMAGFFPALLPLSNCYFCESLEPISWHIYCFYIMTKRNQLFPPQS